MLIGQKELHLDITKTMKSTEENYFSFLTRSRRLKVNF